MKTRQPTIVSASVAMILACLVAQDFVPGATRVGLVCFAVLLGVALGVALGRADRLAGVGWVGRWWLDRLAAGRPDGSVLVSDRAEMVGALIQWGREEILAISLGRHLTALGVFTKDGSYAENVEALTLDRALQIFDEYLEDGCEQAPLAAVPMSGGLGALAEAISQISRPVEADSTGAESRVDQRQASQNGNYDGAIMSPSKHEPHLVATA
jgi:hypothetical protein